MLISKSLKKLQEVGPQRYLQKVKEIWRFLTFTIFWHLNFLWELFEPFLRILISKILRNFEDKCLIVLITVFCKLGLKRAKNRVKSLIWACTVLYINMKNSQNCFTVHFTVIKIFTRFLDFFWPNLPETWTGYIIPGQREFGKWHPDWGREYRTTFLQCSAASTVAFFVITQSLADFLADGRTGQLSWDAMRAGPLAASLPPASGLQEDVHVLLRRSWHRQGK